MINKRAIVIISILLILDCACGGYIGIWREKFWNAVAHKYVYDFLFYTAEFTIVALLDCLVIGYMQYTISMFALDMRTKLTEKAIALATHESIEGGNQRVQEDCMSYPLLLTNLWVGIGKAIIMIGIFAYILLLHLNIIYLFFPILYSLMGTGIAALIAHPLIKLNYLNQVVEAKFRQVLKMPVYKQEVYVNNYNLFKWTKYLAYFQVFYQQINEIVPYLGLSFLYFSGKLTFGAFMQVARSMIEIINNLSYLITSFNDINKLLSCRKRLKEINII